MFTFVFTFVLFVLVLTASDKRSEIAASSDVSHSGGHNSDIWRQTGQLTVASIGGVVGVVGVVGGVAGVCCAYHRIMHLRCEIKPHVVHMCLH